MSTPKRIEDLKEVFPFQRGRVPLMTSHPQIAFYWYYKKNCGFGPEDFSYGSMTQVWWFCDKSPDHIFQQAIKTRVRGSLTGTDGCPFCAGQKPSPTNWLHSFKSVAKEFHKTKNGALTPKTVVASSNKKRWWTCSKCNRNFHQTVHARTHMGQGCPKCNLGERLDLRKYPGALKMFDKKKNKGVDIKNMGYHNFFWWRCQKGKDHIWKAGFYQHNRPTPECPFCSSRQPSSTNNLTLDKRLAGEFHPTKNGTHTASDFTLGSHSKIWWKCAKGADHEWQQIIFMRSKRGNNCPYCSGFKLSTTNVLSAFTRVARDFHPTKNGKLKPDHILATAQRKIFWRCFTCKYEWAARPYQRTTEGLGCPECYKKNTGRGRLSSRQKEQAAKLLKSGMAVAKIADKVGVHFMTIYRIRDAIAGGKEF